MQKIITAGILALSLILPAVAVPPATPLKQAPPAKTEADLLKTGFIIKLTRFGMLIVGEKGSVFISWNELFAYRYMMEQKEAQKGRAD